MLQTPAAAPQFRKDPITAFWLCQRSPRMTCPVGLLRGVGCPGDGAVARALDQGHPDAHSESVRGFADSRGRGGARGGCHKG